MAFKSANFKLVLEVIRDLGIPLTASEIGKLLLAHELDEIVDAARDTLERIDTVTETITAWTETRDRHPVASREWYKYEHMLEPIREVLAELEEMWSSGELWD